MNHLHTRIKRAVCAWGVGLLCALALGNAVAGDNVNGAIYTTIADGTKVNGNIYDAKKFVYLNGGPQNPSNPGLVPDGPYYFQVTDPSGHKR